MAWRLEQAGLEARRFPAPAGQDLERLLGRRAAKGRRTPSAPPAGEEDGPGGDHARALGLRLLLAGAMRERRDAVRIICDGTAFHPNFQALAAAVEPPDDWEVFHLGHTLLDGNCKPAAPGVVKIGKGAGFHAFQARGRAVRDMAAALASWCRDPAAHGTLDGTLAAATERLNRYCCFPNLAWHDPHAHLPGLAGKAGYDPGGTQTREPELVWRLHQEMFRGGLPGFVSGPEAGRSRLGLLFLTSGDVHHPRIWREYVGRAPGRVRVFSHPKHPHALRGGFLEGTAIGGNIPTAWGDISLVRATLALLRTALADPSLTHFALVSESCVPVRPLSAALKLLDRNPRSRFDWRDLASGSPTEKRRALDLPGIPGGCWRFQSQWWLLERCAAEWVARVDYTEMFRKMEIPDEGYFSTALCLTGFPLDGFVERTHPTWTRWEGGPHPLPHGRLASGDLRSIVESRALFARKFPPGADIGQYGLHR